jgi:phosphoribosyl-ATP pyrophosphohydrolase
MSEAYDPDALADVLSRLADIIESRKDADPATSYVASLLGGDETRVLKKIGEESVELVVAIRDADTDSMVHEAADLWFHTLVALAGHGVRAERVLEELGRRFARSGLEEKAMRRPPD